MKRRLALFDAAMRALARRSGRSLTVVLALALTTMLFSATYFLAESLRHTSTELAAHAPAIVVSRTVAGRPALLPAESAAAVADIIGVRSVRARVTAAFKSASR